MVTPDPAEANAGACATLQNNRNSGAVAAAAPLTAKTSGRFGWDNRSPYLFRITRLSLASLVIFAKPWQGLLQYYAAADLTTGPSLEDSYGLGVQGAMACGLPVKSSAQSGVSEIIADGIDGLVLAGPFEGSVLPRWIQLSHERPDLHQRIGQVAAQTAQQYSWDRNAADSREFPVQALQNKNMKY
jgi:glycosyltransferase involved in cell wall biosynthesis